MASHQGHPAGHYVRVPMGGVLRISIFSLTVHIPLCVCQDCAVVCGGVVAGEPAAVSRTVHVGPFVHGPTVEPNDPSSLTNAFDVGSRSVDNAATTPDNCTRALSVAARALTAPRATITPRGCPQGCTTSTRPRRVRPTPPRGTVPSLPGLGSDADPVDHRHVLRDQPPHRARFVQRLQRAPYARHGGVSGPGGGRGRSEEQDDSGQGALAPCDPALRCEPRYPPTRLPWFQCGGAKLIDDASAAVTLYSPGSDGAISAAAPDVL